MQGPGLTCPFQSCWEPLLPTCCPSVFVLSDFVAYRVFGDPSLGMSIMGSAWERHLSLPW